MPRALRFLTSRRWAPVIFAFSAAAYLVVRHYTHATSGDLFVYRSEGAALRHGVGVYGQLYGLAGDPPHAHATYPPFAVLLFVPLSWLSDHALVALGVAANLALLLIVVRLSRRLVGAFDWPSTYVVAAALLWTEPVFTTLRYGQINLAVLALVLADLTARRWHGIGIGVAAGIKITPVIFIGYLAVTRRWADAGRALAAFAATIALSGLIVPSDTVSFWTRHLFEFARVGRLEHALNQSARGVMVRLDHTRATVPGELLFVVAIGVAGLAVAAAAYRHFGEAWGLPCCAVTGLLVSPISWSHHWVWCVPVAVLLWHERRRWLPGLLVFWTFAVWAVPHRDGAELRFGPALTALSAWYVLAGVAFLVAVGARVLHAPASVRPLPDSAGTVSDSHRAHELAGYRPAALRGRGGVQGDP